MFSELGFIIMPTQMKTMLCFPFFQSTLQASFTLPAVLFSGNTTDFRQFPGVITESCSYAASLDMKGTSTDE